MAESFGDRFEAGPFGLAPKRVVGIGGVDDLSKQHQRSVLLEAVLLHDRFEGAFLAVMAELDVRDVEGGSGKTLCFQENLAGRDEVELRVGVHESLDKPRTSDAIDFDALASDPFHGDLLCGDAYGRPFMVRTSTSTSRRSGFPGPAAGLPGRGWQIAFQRCR